MRKGLRPAFSVRAQRQAASERSSNMLYAPTWYSVSNGSSGSAAARISPAAAPGTVLETLATGAPCRAPRPPPLCRDSATVVWRGGCGGECTADGGYNRFAQLCRGQSKFPTVASKNSATPTLAGLTTSPCERLERLRHEVKGQNRPVEFALARAAWGRLRALARLPWLSGLSGFAMSSF